MIKREAKPASTAQPSLDPPERLKEKIDEFLKRKTWDRQWLRAKLQELN
jgi:hypothetical protein